MFMAWAARTLEDEGLVHISSGTNYTVSANAQDGGEATHKLTGAEMPSHGHQVRLYNTNGSQGTWKNYDGYGTTVITNQYGLRNPMGGWTNSTTATSAQNGYGDQAGITTQNGGSVAHNNMQPYKIVNRWHRTA